MTATASNIVQFPRFNAPSQPDRIRLRGAPALDSRQDAAEALGEYVISKVKEISFGTGVDLSQFNEIVEHAFVKLARALPTSFRDAQPKAIVAKGTEAYEALLKVIPMYDAIRVIEATGAVTLAELRRVPNEKLQRVDGIGKTKLARIRDVIANSANGRIAI